MWGDFSEEAGGLVEKEGVEYDASGHCLYNWHGTGKYAGVMASAGFERGRVACGIDCRDFTEERGNGFECDAEVNVDSVGYAALYATGIVGERGYVTVVGDECVEHLRTA